MKIYGGRKWIWFGVMLPGVIGAILFWQWSNLERQQYRFSADAVDGGYTLAELQLEESFEKLESAHHRIQINVRPTADPETGLCNLMIGNPDENEMAVLVVIFRDDNGEELYRSDLIRPGERQAYGYLGVMPAAGEYLLTAVFQLVNVETQEIGGEVEAGLVLTVESGF